MKRLVLTGLLAVAACSVGTSASAQSIAKGKNELTTEAFFITAKPTGDVDDERFTSAELTTSYGRFLTDRLAAGPVFKVSKSKGSDAVGYVGGQGRYYFGDLTRRLIPVVELSAARSFNDPTANYTDLQLLAGVVIPVGSGGGRLRVAPYYYRAFYDEAVTGYSNYQSFGISWSIALLF